MKKLCLMGAVSFAVVAAQAAVVPLVNGDFESYTPVGAAPAPGGTQVRGLTPGEFWDGSGNFTTLDGWSEGAGSTWADSGTEAGGYNPTLSRNLYLMGGDGVAEQTTSYAIGSSFGVDEWFVVNLLVGDIWDWADLQINLYADTPANVIATTSFYSDVGATGWWSTLTETSVHFHPDVVANAGSNLGISLSNSNIGWLAVDNVEIIAVPEPATLGLVGIFGAAVLFVRRRFMI